MRLADVTEEAQSTFFRTVAVNGWCGCHKILCAREAVKGLEHTVEYTEIGTSDSGNILHLGTVGGIFLDGEVFRAYQLCMTDALRAEIIRLYSQKDKRKSRGQAQT